MWFSVRIKLFSSFSSFIRFKVCFSLNNKTVSFLNFVQVLVQQNCVVSLFHLYLGKSHKLNHNTKSPDTKCIHPQNLAHIWFISHLLRLLIQVTTWQYIPYFQLSLSLVYSDVIFDGILALFEKEKKALSS